MRAGFTATRAVAGSYEIDFRIEFKDEIRWISARSQGADAGISDRVMFGIFLDVTGRKQAQEGSELLAGEMSHRVKNLLQENVLTHPVDADLGSVFGWGFPAWAGGTLSLIETVGVFEFVAQCDSLAQCYGPRFTPPANLRAMTAAGQEFDWA